MKHLAHHAKSSDRAAEKYKQSISVNVHIKIYNLATSCCSAAAPCHLAGVADRCPPKARVNPVCVERKIERGLEDKDLRDCCPSLHTREKFA